MCNLKFLTLSFLLVLLQTTYRFALFPLWEITGHLQFVKDFRKE